MHRHPQTASTLAGSGTGAVASLGGRSRGLAPPAVVLMSPDVVHEDMTAHTYIRSRIQGAALLRPGTGTAAYGPGAALVHTEGSRRGGGYEWSASPVASPIHRDHTLIELGSTSKISRLAVICDSSLLSYHTYQSLVGAAPEAPLS